MDLVPKDSLSKFKKYLNNKFLFFTDYLLFDYNMISGTGSKILTKILWGGSVAEWLGFRTLDLKVESSRPVCSVSG